MGKIIVDVDVLINGIFETMFKDVTLDVEEKSNKKMNRAFGEQHPRLLAKIPTYKDNRSFTFRYAFECRPHSWR